MGPESRPPDAAAAGPDDDGGEGGSAGSNSNSNRSGRKRSCWECQRRRVVCDAGRPVCFKCRVAGIVCPGYDDKKPLTWVAPNQVTTRTWRARKPSGERPKRNSRGGDEGDVETIRKEDAASPGSVNIFPGQELRNETCDIAQASVYWNDHVYPYFYSNQLTKSPWVVPVSHIDSMRPYRQHGLVTMAIEHRMSRLSPTRTDPYAREVRTRAYHHRAAALKALNGEIGDPATRCSDATLAGVIGFLFGDLMGDATASNWRFHINGFAALIELRGGWEEFCRTAPQMRSLVLFCKIIENLANTTSPADDQLSPVANYKMRDLIADVFSIGYYPQLPCPVDLFIDIIHINSIRHVASRNKPGHLTNIVRSEAKCLLGEMLKFSPEEWLRETKSSDEGHLLMAEVYHSAVVIFGISSLQSVGAVPLSADWATARKTHGDRLFALLRESTRSPALKICTAWPLIVAGFEAKGAGRSRRAFVLGRMDEDSRRLGIWLPVAAKEVLERFYASAGKTWDDCFDSPRALFT
ncbi:C6 zinc finger domain-containing protein [Colletotrichum plurivorum]|uniref:C6 zinc finger domain-containing protein n=1 Tax=Colletotrichum plurivorum TaxID=2175906 RepID=A0A8H6JMZ7_9PEZI|nr:C6 zinc finger domain-containing protein [Colletotrichum plurivorum]